MAIEDANKWQPEQLLLEVTQRRRCGCVRTSDKLSEVLRKFPAPPPPSPVLAPHFIVSPNALGQGNYFTPLYAQHLTAPAPHAPALDTLTPDKRQLELTDTESDNLKEAHVGRWWYAVSETVRLVQLTVAAAALLLYYLIYCYMQLVYYTLRSALFFHHADGPMKVTIGVVAVTSLLILFNLFVRIEKSLQLMCV